jgi:hypothetical protein
MTDRTFTEAEVNLFREWYDALYDLHASYLEPADHELAKKVGGQSPHVRRPAEPEKSR